MYFLSKLWKYNLEKILAYKIMVKKIKCEWEVLIF